MGNCLVTKLKSIVDNDALIKIGELCIDIDYLSTTYLRQIYFLGCPVKFSENIYFKKTNSSNETLILAGTEITMTSESKIRQETAGPCRITLIDKYNITILNAGDVTTTFVQTPINLEDLKYCDKLSSISAFINGNFSDLDNIKNLLVNITGHLESNASIKIPVDFLNDCQNLLYFSLKNIKNYSNIDIKFIGDIHDITLNSEFRTFDIQYVEFDLQFITNIATCIKLTIVGIKNSDISYVNTFAAAQVAAGRNSGSCTFYRLGYLTKIIKYGTSMVNPTETETALGYQLVNG